MTNRRINTGDYTVGLICALPIELAAVTRVLDEDHGPLPYDPHDSNSYTLGRVGRHNVVIACLPAGRLGLSPATHVATQMQSKFRSLFFGLMVGVGGGVPTEEDDVRLGDVVISQPNGQHGGVVQYDMGKTGAGGRFERTGFLNSPPNFLLTALGKLRAESYLKRSLIPGYLAASAQEPEFSYQGRDHDVLYNPGYDHVKGLTCKGCDPKEIAEREFRGTTDPILHYGTIASGNQVIKDSRTRDRLSEDLGKILCFEMEAAGLMNNFDCLVIRGICDYADSHKNKRWQP